MKEKTAISYLIEEVNEIMAHIEVSKETNFRLAVVSIKAKEMERQQIEEAWVDGFYPSDVQTAEQYFTENYE